jgi:aspartate/methionine/tyrosine aminotransferase
LLIPHTSARSQAATHDPTTYSYCLKHGTLPLLQAACSWYQKRYDVLLDPHTEAL